MKKILNFDSEDFAKKLNHYIRNNRSANPDISEKVRKIINSIIDDGDKALCDLTLKYDDYDILDKGICVDDR